MGKWKDLLARTLWKASVQVQMPTFYCFHFYRFFFSFFPKELFKKLIGVSHALFNWILKTGSWCCCSSHVTGGANWNLETWGSLAQAHSASSQDSNSELSGSRAVAPNVIREWLVLEWKYHGLESRETWLYRTAGARLEDIKCRTLNKEEMRPWHWFFKQVAFFTEVGQEHFCHEAGVQPCQEVSSNLEILWWDREPFGSTTH